MDKTLLGEIMEKVELDKKDIREEKNGLIYFDAELVASKLPTKVLFDYSKSEIQSIIDCIHDGIYITDGDGYTLMLNKASRDLIPEDIPNLIGKNVREMVAEGYWNESICLEVIKQKKPVSKIQIVNNAEILTTVIPYFKNGKLKRMVATDRNVSDLAELTRQLQKTEKALQKYESGLEYYRKQNIPSESIIYKSKVMQDLVDSALKVAKQDVTILIQGESGTGKEVLANLIYSNSLRKNEPFIKINCATIPENLIESELFGYEKGSFTGADKKGKIGLFEIASNGTLLLDEITELSMHMQSNLLRVLQENEIMRIGGRERIPIDVRIIAATNLNLRKAIVEGKFREDLFYRLNIIPFEVPPLRERADDIEEMIKCFIEQFNKKYHVVRTIDDDAMEIFSKYEWPGNVRELKNVIERLIVTNDSEGITRSQVASQIYSDSVIADALNGTGKSLTEQVELFEKRLLQMTLEKAMTSSEAARMLGVNKSTISKKIKKYGIIKE